MDQILQQYLRMDWNIQVCTLTADTITESIIILWFSIDIGLLEKLLMLNSWSITVKVIPVQLLRYSTSVVNIHTLRSSFIDSILYYIRSPCPADVTISYICWSTIMSKRVKYPNTQYLMGIRDRSTVQWMLTPAFLFPLSILQVLVDNRTGNIQEIHSWYYIEYLAITFCPYSWFGSGLDQWQLVLDRQGLQADRGVQSEDFS